MVGWAMLQVVLKQLKEAVGKAEVDQTTLAYVAALACPLIDRKIFDKGDWVEVRPNPPLCKRTRSSFWCGLGFLAEEDPNEGLA